MLFNRLPSIWLYIIPLFIFGGCASPRAPTGGEKDELPPVLIEEESTPNFQTNFSEKQITLTFDEWFSLKDVNTQLVISPLMPEQPEVKQKGKSIYITLPDSLKEETTYTLNFGSAIADLNEGNVLENFAFVFSTGEVLDSVSISGKVTDAVTLKPAADILVMLHPFEEDSAVFKKNPEYVARTDEEGRWQLANIRSDTFSVVVLIDDNLNFLYDLESEYFGWYDEALTTNIPKILVPDIFIFPKELRTSIRDIIHSTPGWLKVVVNGPKPYPVPTLVPPIDDAVSAWDGDTIHFWYSPELDYQGSAILGEDTVKISSVKNTKSDPFSFRMTNITGKLVPDRSALLYSPVPISKIDTSLVRLIVDTVVHVPYTLQKDGQEARLLLLKGQWTRNKNYLLTALPGAFSNAMGIENDTIRTMIQVAEPDAFGDLTLNVNGLDSSLTYLLILRKGSEEIMSGRIHHLADTVFTYRSLLPAKYQVEMIEDLNENGFWDTGSFYLRRQPERKKIFELESLRAAWEVESTVTWQ